MRREVRVQGMVRVQESRERWEGGSVRREGGNRGGNTGLDTETAPVVNGMRLELRGGSEVPRLRGGGLPYRYSAGDVSPFDADQPIPCLRGGAGSRTHVPPTLYWLAGGTGRPVTISSWNKEKGKKRQGGLLGRVMYGASSGREYASDVGDGRRESIEGSVNSGKVTVGSGSVRSVPVGAEEAPPAAIPLPETPAGEARETEVRSEIVEEAVRENVEHTATGVNVGQAARNL